MKKDNRKQQMLVKFGHKSGKSLSGLGPEPDTSIHLGSYYL
ncbi:hypothetical protein SAMN05443550_110184 [Pedobacter hartonius]|uniref:Uncharacterized protein n=1 Tax=Pedobacter hartonius TaxID=425514 RepID=A0A1H4GPJ6_9SPHI|nr:hypothetical protein SAMN05443550_110184 [Pedobacter hartonius]